MLQQYSPPMKSSAHQHAGSGTTEFVPAADRGHSLTINAGWRDVAQAALALIGRFS